MTKNKKEAGRTKSALCAACGTAFEKSRDWQIFCSDKCRKDSWKTDKLNARRIIQLEIRQDQVEVRLARIETKFRIRKAGS